MRRMLAFGLLLGVSAAAQAGDVCTGRIAASVLAYDRDLRQGAGLLLNQCGRPVRAQLLVIARNRDGFPIARLRTEVHAGAAPLSVIRVDLPFVQSVIRLSGYSSEIAATESLDVDTGRTAALRAVPLPEAPRL
jgi:hypothetical protein